MIHRAGSITDTTIQSLILTRKLWFGPQRSWQRPHWMYWNRHESGGTSQVGISSTSYGSTLSYRFCNRTGPLCLCPADSHTRTHSIHPRCRYPAACHSTQCNNPTCSPYQADRNPCHTPYRTRTGWSRSLRSHKLDGMRLPLGQPGPAWALQWFSDCSPGAAARGKGICVRLWWRLYPWWRYGYLPADGDRFQ